MGEHRSYRRTNAAVAAAFFMALLIILVISVDKLGESAVLAIVVAAPLILYLIASGDVAEVSGPGGLVAKFKADAKAPVDSNAEIEEPQLVSKGLVAQLHTQLPRYKPGKPVALMLRLGSPASGYTPRAIEQYIVGLIGVDPQLTVTFVDSERKFVASTDGARILYIVRDAAQGSQFVTFMDSNDVPSMRAMVALSTRSMSRKETNAAALKIMAEDDVSSIVAVDEQRFPVGLVRRDRIIARLVASLASS